MDSPPRNSRLSLVAVVAAALFAVPVGSAVASPDGVGRSTAYAYGSVLADSHQVSANVASGNLTFNEHDIPLPNTEGLTFSRTYNSALSSVRRDLGFGWTTNAGYDVRLTVSGTNLQLVDATGHRVDFTANGSGGYTSSNADYAAEALPGGGWQITVPPPGGILTFNSQGLLTTTTVGDDALGYTYTSAGGQDRLSSIVDPGTTNTRPSYNGDGSIIEIDDPASQHYYYGYNGAKHLTAFAGPGGASASYGYDTGGRVNAISWSGGASTAVTYDGTGRVTQIVGTSADSSVDAITFAYSTSVTGCPVLSVGTTVVVDSDGEGATYCWRADFVITKITPIDTVAPGADATGELVDASNFYAALDSEQTVTLLGSDDRSGIRQLRLDVDGTTVDSVNATCDDGQLGTACPLDFAAEVEYDPSGLAPGEHTFTVVAVDDAGNIGSSESWTVTIDRTGPSETDTLQAFYDDAQDETRVQWSGDEDASAGMGTWRYRTKRNSGNWSIYRTVNRPIAILPGGDVGDEIKVQVTPTDRAGNSADESDVETEATSYQDFLDLLSEDDAPSARSSNPITDYSIECKVEDSQTDIRLSNSYTLQATGQMHCKGRTPPIAALLYGYPITLKVCPAYNDETVACDDKWEVTERMGLNGATIRSRSFEVCLPGTRPYRTYFHSEEMDQDEVRGNTQNLTCDGAAAFKFLAKRDTRDPGETLGNNMPKGYNHPGDPTNGADEQEIPIGTSARRRGWAAHHVIPHGYKNTNLTKAQEAAFACNIRPNGAVNGVWLRDRPLKYTTDRSKPYWTDLAPRPSLRLRDYHPSVHNTRYFKAVSAAIGKFMNPNKTCKTIAQNGVNGQSGIATALRTELRVKLQKGKYTDGV